MALVPRGHLGFCHYERSINCHRERSVAICWQWDCRAVHSARLAMTRTAGKCRTGKEIASVTTFLRNDKGLAASSGLSWQVVIANAVWRSLTMRLPRRVFYTSRNDKNRGKCRTGKEIASVTTFLRNDKSCRLLRLQ